jgi:hypothetical protein
MDVNMPEPPEPEDDLSEQLSMRSRILAVAFGLSAGGFGTLAVFRTDNQAGTALLLALSAALLLIGLQGSPLIRIGSGDSNIQLARIRRRATREVVRAVQDERPEVSQAVLEAVESIAPDLVSSSLLGRRYERMIVAAIAIVDPSLIITENSWDEGADLTVRNLHGVSVGVDVKYMGPQKIGKSQIIDAENRVVGSAMENRLIVVTNARPTDEAQRYLVDRSIESARTQLVIWNGSSDNPALALALSRQLQSDTAGEG